jgi:glutathione synthase/RimK-type ligase-like ATP-grasp enzyme
MPASTVVIVAPHEDVHARALAAAVARRGGTATIFDMADFPARDRATFGIGGAGDGFELGVGNARLALDTVHSVWWRRPARPRIAEEVADERVRAFCVAESETLLRGALDACGVPIVNNPSAQARAARKPLQLALARALGLSIPRTVMSNDAAHIRALWDACGGHCVYKTFTAPDWTIAETRPMTLDVLADLDKLRHAPVIVQERIDGRDVRVTVIGDRVCAALTHARLPEGVVDTRLDRAATWTPHDLPTEVRSRLSLLLDRLGLDYGCIDLRLCPDGRHVFLEINPAGQFLFMEIDTGAPLCDWLAERLLDPGVRERRLARA